MDTSIYFVRHAHSQFDIHNEEKRELSEKGWKDAERVTKILKQESIDFIYSSPYVRSIQTVQGLADFLQTDVQTDSRLREGWLADVDVVFDEPDQAMKYAFQNPHFRYKGGESVSDVQKRGCEALEGILLKHKGKSIAIGTHGYILTSLVSYYEPAFDYDFCSKTTKPDIYRAAFEGTTYRRIERLWVKE